jgi:hypothetical protein
VQSCVVDVCKRLGISAVLRHPIKRRSQLPHVLTALATFGRTLLKSGYSSARVQPLTESPSITVVDYFNGFDIAAANTDQDFGPIFQQSLATNSIHLSGYISETLASNLFQRINQSI